MATLLIFCDSSLFERGKLPKGSIILNSNVMAEDVARQIMENPRITKLSVVGTRADTLRMLNNISRVLERDFPHR